MRLLKVLFVQKKAHFFSSVISLFLPYALESCRLSKILACEIQVIFLRIALYVWFVQVLTDS